MLELVDPVSAVIQRVNMARVVDGDDPVFEVAPEEYADCLEFVNISNNKDPLSSMPKGGKRGRKGTAASKKKATPKSLATPVLVAQPPPKASSTTRQTRKAPAALEQSAPSSAAGDRISSTASQNARKRKR